MKKGILFQIVSNRKITLFITAMVVIAGVFSYSSSIKQESPDFDVPVAIVSFSYIGAGAAEVEAFVLNPIESEMMQVDGWSHFTSYSRNNGGLFMMEFEYDVDRDEAYDEVRRRLDDLLFDMPSGVEIIDIIAGELTVTDFMYILTSDGSKDMQDMAIEASKMMAEMNNIEDVKSVHLQGEQLSEIQVTVENSAFQNMPLTRYDLGALIGSFDARLPGGSLEDGGSTQIQNTSGLKDMTDIESIIIGINPATGTPITLNQLASIDQVYEDTVYTNYDGNQGIIIYGYFDDNIDQTGIADEFLDSVEQIELEDGYKLNKIIYYPEDVKVSNNNFFMNLLIGIGLVMLVSFFSMGYRNAIIVSFALPISVLMSMIIMRVFGIKLHQISIAALIVAIGMLVDNAIVITESIKRKIEDGMDRLEATIKGTKEVAIPVLSSTLTTLAAFSPLLFIPSVVGDYIKSVPQVIIIALSSSYIVSITLMPCLAYMVFNHLDGKTGEGKFLKWTGNAVTWLQRKRVIVLVIVLALSAFALTLIPKIGLSFFPTADKDMMYINVVNKEGGIEETKTKIDSVEEVLASEAYITHYVTSVGRGLPRFWDTMRPYYDASDFGQFLIEVDLQEQIDSNSEYASALQERLNSIDDTLKIEVKELEKSEPVLAPIVIQVTGEQLEGLHEAKVYTSEILSGIEGVTFIRDDEVNMSEQYDLVYDNEAISKFGLVLSMVQAEVAYEINGFQVANLADGETITPVYLKGSVEEYEALGQLIVGHSDGNEPILLSDVASFELIETRSSITRYDGSYTIKVLANIEDGYASTDIMTEFRAQLDEALYSDIIWAYAGEQQSIIDNFSDVGMMAMIAVFLILIILVIQFKSFLQTGIIIASIPLAASGAIYGLFISGYPLSFTALFGIVSLMGIVVNNAILLVDSINIQRKMGMSISEATFIGTKKRIRPILLTTITTIMGLIPLIISGSELFAPMAIAIGSGLLFATLITLLVIPILYGLIIREKATSINHD